MRKVLLLTAAYGEGHNAAARGLQAAFTQLGADARIVDSFARTGGAFYEWSRRGYLALINSHPKAWAGIYGLIDRVPIASLALPFLGAVFRDLRQVIQQTRPDAVLSVYPAYGYLLEHLYPQRRPFACHTVITDSITVNSVWYRCGSDTFIVANEDTADVLLAAGVPAGKIRTLGFPVAPGFASGRPERRPPSPPRVLYMINAGRDRASGIIRRLLAIEPLHLTVTVGRDDALRAEVEAIAAELGKPIEIHGWTDRMPELLMTHHLLIGKAGGATVQETIAARTPMILTQIVPGQEEGNAKLLLQNRCGALCESADAVGITVEKIFHNGAARWQEWEQNITRLSKPDAAAEIARFVLATE